VREAQEREGEAETIDDLALPDLTAALAEHRDEASSDLLDAVLELQPLPGEIRRWLKLLKYRRGRLEAEFAYGEDDDRPHGVVFVAPRGIQERALREVLGAGTALDAAAPPATEDDWLGSTPGYPQPLAEHSCEVRDLARMFGRSTGLTEALVVDVALAAYLHDAGKADPRFQTMLYGGAWFAVDETTVLAKSARRGSRAAWERAGLPEHWRHEALSVRIAREHPLFEEAHDKELVLWLIGVHHGYGRPLFPHADPCDGRDRDLAHIEGERFRLEKGAGPQSLAFSFDGWDWAQIFERLKRRYGVWELARMEAIVRLADHRASEAAGLRAAPDVAQ
jgi:CRISPR-associated endonuclease/helicase Cas3